MINSTLDRMLRERMLIYLFLILNFAHALINEVVQSELALIDSQIKEKEAKVIEVQNFITQKNEVLSTLENEIIKLQNEVNYFNTKENYVRQFEAKEKSRNLTKWLKAYNDNDGVKKARWESHMTQLEHQEARLYEKNMYELKISGSKENLLALIKSKQAEIAQDRKS